MKRVMKCTNCGKETDYIEETILASVDGEEEADLCEDCVSEGVCCDWCVRFTLDWEVIDRGLYVEHVCPMHDEDEIREAKLGLR